VAASSVQRGAASTTAASGVNRLRRLSISSVSPGPDGGLAPTGSDQGRP
jgi:hypothetical protein